MTPKQMDMFDTLLPHPDHKSQDPPWLDEAHRLLGVKEVKGDEQHPTLEAMAHALSLMNFQDDRDPWCTLFIAHCLKTALPDEPLPKHLIWSRAYAKWGIPLKKPVRGCVVVTWRGKSAAEDLGHAFFYLSDAGPRHMKGIGGNQSDSVSVTQTHRKDRVIGYFWPSTYPLPPEAETL
jgi:uncharacterized protein (TIGR02594 family)